MENDKIMDFQVMYFKDSWNLAYLPDSGVIVFAL